MKETIETFMDIRGYTLNQFIKKEISCFNGNVNIESYKVTVEKIEESKEVYEKRLQFLWDKCDNHHHWVPLKEKAKELGIELKGEAGKS